MKPDQDAQVLQRRRRAIAALLLGAAIAGFPPAFAQTDYPARPIKMIVPFGPGTSTDTVTRIVADAMSRSLGQAIIVENKSGGGGTIGTEFVARSPADGYTLVMGTVGTHAINKALYRKLGYDPARDFQPLAFIGQTPTLLVVSAASPFNSLKDLVAAASKPAGISFASAGSGTSGHLAGELLKAKLGGDMVHVPYKEGGLALSDVMSGQTQFMFYHPAAVLSHIKAGKLRALGVSGARRSESAPEVPTIAEQIGGDFDLVAWFMVFAPSATPEPVLAKLRTAAKAALAHPETAARLLSQGIEKNATASGDPSNYVQREVAKWGEVVKRSGAQVD